MKLQMERQRRVHDQVIQDVLRFGRYLLMASRIERANFFWMAAAVYLLLESTALSGYCAVCRVKFFIEAKVSRTLISLSIVTLISAFSICIWCYMMAGFACKHSKRFSDSIIFIEKIMENTDFNDDQPRYHTLSMKLTLALYLLVKLGFLIMSKFLNNALQHYLISVFPEVRRATFILIYKVFLIKSLAKNIRKRYEFLIDSTKKLFKQPELPHFMIMMKIKRMQKIVRLLYLQSEELNHLLGITIFLCILFTVFGCLYSVGFVLSDWQAGELTYTHIVDSFTECGIRLIFIYQITMALDRVQNAAKKLTKMIHKAKLLSKNEEILEELHLFAKYSKELVPKFIAGCFKVDRYLLSSSIGAIATYLIVIIQFSILPDYDET